MNRRKFMWVQASSAQDCLEQAMPRPVFYMPAQHNFQTKSQIGGKNRGILSAPTAVRIRCT